MISMGTKDVILDFVLEREENLRMALLLGSVYDDLRIKIIAAFAEDLGKELKKSLGQGWTVDVAPLMREPLARFTGFSVAKTTWSDRYGIWVEAQKQGAREFVMGVWKKPEANGIDDLKDLLDQHYGYGKSNQYWVWWQYVEDRYRNWDDEEVLTEMWFQRRSVIDYFRERIMKIGDLAAPHIDKAMVNAVSRP